MVAQSKCVIEHRPRINNLESVVKGRARKHRLARSSSCNIPRKSLFRVATLNAGTMRGRSSKAVERTSRGSIDLYCMQSPLEWFFCQIHNRKRSRYKCFWVVNHTGTGGVGIILIQKWLEKVFDVNWVSLYKE